MAVAVAVAVEQLLQVGEGGSEGPVDVPVAVAVALEQLLQVRGRGK